MARYAILIGNSRYPEEPGLDELRCPEHDVDALAAVLDDPERGGFEKVLTFKNETHYVLLGQIHRLLTEAGSDHLVLVYFSGHGLLDDTGQLYLATADTTRAWLATSAVAVSRIRELVDRIGNRRAVLILDCCHVGAADHMDVDAALKQASDVGEEPGRGMYILAASTAIRTAEEKETDENGLYTRHLVAGIRTGEADLDQDGRIGIDELHRYVRDQLLAEHPVQEPRLWGLEVGDPPVIAESGREPRKLREQQIRRRLLDMTARRYIPDELLSRVLSVAGKPVDELTPREQALDALLDRLIDDDITPAEFILGWMRIGDDTASEPSSATPSSIGAFPSVTRDRPVGDARQRVLSSKRVLSTAALLILGLVLVPTVIRETGERESSPDRVPSGDTIIEDGTAAFPVGEVLRDPLAGGGEGPAMVMIPAGEFLMGSPEIEVGRSNDERQHPVSIERPFAIGKYAVTFAEYDRFAEATGRELPDDSGWGRGERPVVDVSWYDAMAYAAWLSEQTGEDYRLPTEAEWEYAARAGTTTPFHTGECIHTDQANYDGNVDYADCGAKTGIYRQRTVPVGSLPANPWGLHEVHGNVWEWTCSAWDADYSGAEQRCDAQAGRRAVRGGSWGGDPHGVRAAFRGWVSPERRGVGRGFRLARSL